MPDVALHENSDRRAPRTRWVPFLAGGCLGVLAGAAVLLAGLLIAYNFYQKEAIKKMAETQELKPVQLRADFAWTLDGLDGTRLDMGELRGRPVFLHLWRPECVSCIAEVPGINAIYDTFAPRGVAFVSVALETDRDGLGGALGMHDVRFPVYTLTGALPPIFQTAATPTTYVIDRAGFVVYSRAGAAAWDTPDVRAFLEHLTGG